MKTAITGISLVIYLIAYTWYLVLLKSVALTPEQQKLYNYYPILFLLLVIWITERSGIESSFHVHFLDISKATLSITFLTIILHYHLILMSITSMLLFLYCGTFLATLGILIFGGRHGHFNDE